MTPTAINPIDKTATRLEASGVSSLGGGYTTRAIVAEVQPLHQPPQNRRIVLLVSGSVRRCATTRISAHTAAQPMLYEV
jgi:hypothetical protein